MKRKIDAEEKRRICRLYSEGLGINPISAMVGWSTATVHSVVIAAGIRRSKQQAADLASAKNPLQWGTITPERAWFLGLLYGDGGFHHSGNSMTLTIGDEDRDILPKVQSLLGYEGTLNHRTGCTQLGIHGSRFTREIGRTFRLDENKCKNMEWPALPEQVIRHFVRGLLDSDGSWHVRGGREKDLLVFTYSSTSRQFVVSMEEAMSRYLDVCKRVVREQIRHKSTIEKRLVNRSPIYSIDYGHLDARIIGNWLYQGKTEHIRGERKFAIWRKGMERKIPGWCLLRHHTHRLRVAANH